MHMETHPARPDPAAGSAAYRDYARQWLGANLPAAQTRIATLSRFEQVDARTHGAVPAIQLGQAVDDGLRLGAVGGGQAHDRTP